MQYLLEIRPNFQFDLNVFIYFLQSKIMYEKVANLRYSLYTHIRCASATHMFDKNLHSIYFLPIKVIKGVCTTVMKHAVKVT